MVELDTNWDTTNCSPSHFSSPISTIHLCPLKNELNEGDEEGNPPTNHWTICLQTSPSSSIMLDMAPGYGTDGLRGKLEVTALDKPYTIEALRTFQFSPLYTITVDGFLAVIARNERQKYNFHESWEGCRYWMSVVIDDLEHAGVVREGSAKVAMEALSRYWVNPEGSEDREMRRGVFRK
ncbi:hypothetical protein ABW19_dt0204947 [Dactylella cylindrospora]|nr:hypothetical protein ABW19_dt0204947 [Dactylella cylindrospora]